MLKFYFLTYEKMANETLPTVDVKKIQSVIDWLSRREKKELIRLFKFQNILSWLNEEEKKELFRLLNKWRDYKPDWDYNFARTVMYD